MKESKRIDNLSLKIISNLVVSVLMLSVGVLCLVPIQQDVATDGKDAKAHRAEEYNPNACFLP